ncbi:MULTISPECIES: hypothetical protein [Xanthomonas]|uniref:hypothetical protein n=1 Tax=Xanthomonas TaxID=338 RepID=UPI001E2C2C4A|nr:MULTISPECIES: hypothetical protein [Xanthomonas]MCC5068330.1 hypothetical protein [Xanthomonas campestris]
MEIKPASLSLKVFATNQHHEIVQANLQRIHTCTIHTPKITGIKPAFIPRAAHMRFAPRSQRQQGVFKEEP